MTMAHFKQLFVWPSMSSVCVKEIGLPHGQLLRVLGPKYICGCQHSDEIPSVLFLFASGYSPHMAQLLHTKKITEYDDETPPRLALCHRSPLFLLQLYMALSFQTDILDRPKKKSRHSEHQTRNPKPFVETLQGPKRAPDLHSVRGSHAVRATMLEHVEPFLLLGFQGLRASA